MTELEPELASPDTKEHLAPPPKFAWVVCALGVLCLLVAMLDLLSSGHGSKVLRGFEERRSYDMVKRGVHAAWPRVFTMAALGGTLICAGRALARRRARAE